MNDQKQLISSLGEEMTIRQKRTILRFMSVICIRQAFLKKKILVPWKKPFKTSFSLSLKRFQ